MASAEKYSSSGNASEDFSVIFIKIVWFSTSNIIKTSMCFLLHENSILPFKERVTTPFCKEIDQDCGQTCWWCLLLVYY